VHVMLQLQEKESHDARWGKSMVAQGTTRAASARWGSQSTGVGSQSPGVPSVSQSTGVASQSSEGVYTKSFKCKKTIRWSTDDDWECALTSCSMHGTGWFPCTDSD